MVGEKGVSAEATMNSSVEMKSTSGSSKSSAVGVNFSNANDNRTENNGKMHGFQSAFSLVEDGINHACEQLTWKLSDIHLASRRDAEGGNFI